jgi:uncharacterized Tic20 family protein
MASASNSSPVYAEERPGAGERMVAAAAHLLMLATLPGILITATIWILSRKGSPFVRQHARQALRWQILAHLIIFGLIGCTILGIVGGAFGGSINAAYAAGIVLILVATIPYVVFDIPAVIGALKALFGGSARYPVVGGKRR